MRKPESLGYRAVLTIFDRFDTVPACDGHTDGHDDSVYHAK